MTTKERMAAADDGTDSGTYAGRFRDVSQSLKEAQAFGAHYLAAQRDRAILVVRNVVVLGIVGIIAGIAGAGIVVTAAVLLVVGVAGGLGRLFGGIPWLGDLVTAIIIFAGLGIGAWLFVTKLTKTSKKQVVSSYEQRKSQQRSQFGTDVHDQAQQG